MIKCKYKWGFSNENLIYHDNSIAEAIAEAKLIKPSARSIFIGERFIIEPSIDGGDIRDDLQDSIEWHGIDIGDWLNDVEPADLDNLSKRFRQLVQLWLDEIGETILFEMVENVQEVSLMERIAPTEYTRYGGAIAYQYESSTWDINTIPEWVHDLIKRGRIVLWGGVPTYLGGESGVEYINDNTFIIKRTDEDITLLGEEAFKSEYTPLTV